jgi:ATP-dependent DNA helicase RecQ
VQEAERVKKEGKKKEKTGEIEYNDDLFALLRQKRKAMADEIGVPPYVIFSDKTLVEMAAYYPQSITSLLNISGVGQVKLRQYGETFLEVIKAYCEKHNLKENLDHRSAPSSSSKKKRTGEYNTLPPRTLIIAEAFNSGDTIQTLMERHQVTRATIIEHLTQYAMTGHELRDGDDLQSLSTVVSKRQQAVFAAFDELGPGLLKPVFDKLNAQVNYDELRLLRLSYLIAKQRQPG